MADPTPAEYISSLKAALLNTNGANSIKHPDGRTLSFDRAGLIAEIQYWEGIATPVRMNNRRWRMGMRNDY